MVGKYCIPYMVWVITDVFVHVYGTLGTSFPRNIRKLRESEKTLELAYIGGYSLLPYQEELCLWDVVVEDVA